MVDDRHHDEVDVTGMGKGFMDHPVIAVMFGVGVAFGGGQLGARVPPKVPVQPMSKGDQWRLASRSTYRSCWSQRCSGSSHETLVPDPDRCGQIGGGDPHHVCSDGGFRRAGCRA